MFIENDADSSKTNHESNHGQSGYFFSPEKRDDDNPNGENGGNNSSESATDVFDTGGAQTIA